MAPPLRRPRRPGEFSGPRKYTPRRKVCTFCVDKIDEVDYKDVARLRRFLSERGKIEPRRKTGTCAPHQRSLNGALKRARILALLPYTAEHIRVSGVVVREPREPGAGRFGGRGPRPPLDSPPGVGPDGAPGSRPAAPVAPEPGAPEPGAPEATTTPESPAAVAQSPAAQGTGEALSGETGSPTS